MSVDSTPPFDNVGLGSSFPPAESTSMEDDIAPPQGEEAIDLDSLVRDEAMIREGDRPADDQVDSLGSSEPPAQVHQPVRIQGFEPHQPSPQAGNPTGYVGVQGYSGEAPSAFHVGASPFGSNGESSATTRTNPPAVTHDEGSPEVEVVGESGPSMTAQPGHPFRADYSQVMNHPHAPPQHPFYSQQGPSACQNGTSAGFVPQGYHSHSPHPNAYQVSHNVHANMFPGPPPPSMSAQSSSSNGVAIDLTNDDVASRYSQPTEVQPPQPAQLDLTDRRPVCIGSVDTQALILYPISIMQKGSNRDELLRSGDLRVDQGGEEWLKVKLKFRKGKGVAQAAGAAGDAGNGQSADTVINIMSSKQTVVIGVVNGQVHAMFAPLMAKGLIRLEGYIKRGKLENMFTAVLNILCFTLPSNVTYLAEYMANMSNFLDHPLPYYIPENHFDSPIYYNPHNPPVEGFRAMRKNRLDMMMGRGMMQQQQQKTIDIQRDQVDQVFMALPSHDDLPPTDPGDMIKTKLFPHQLKAITFLQQRESEPAAIKAASAASKEEIEIVDVDAEMTEEEKRKQIKRMQKKAEKDTKKKGVNSLWLPKYDSSGKKIKGWKHLVTDETVKGKDKPVEARGAILADEMGLGKTLSIVSLVASTLPSARKFAHVSSKDEPSDSEGSDGDNDDDAGDLDASHFAGSVYGMPSEETNSKKRKRETGYKFTPDKIAKLERKARMDRLRLKSRATLLICPLSTVSNWEEQIRDHWRGKVHVVGASEKGKKTEKAQPEKGDLKIYIYHGNSRKNDLEFLADFDVVITTFSVLQTEYSKQIKTSEGEKSYLEKSHINTAACSSAATPSTSDFGADDHEGNDLDGYGQSLTQGHEKPEVRAERLSLQRNSGDAKKKNKNMDMDLFGKKTASEVVSPLQAVEWFRVVLDEAHFIKDPTTVVSRAACYLEAQRRICLSGTPIQNKLDDIWALFKFLRLAPFDKREVWNKYIMEYAKAGNSLGVVRLQTILKHCTLRRTKDSVNDDGNKILDLPPRHERIVKLKLLEEEKKIYDHHFMQGQKQFQEANEDGSKVDVVNILQQILRLRQICDHPSLLDTCIAEDLEEEIMADGLMDLETAKQAIEKDGINLRRALAYIANLRPEEPASCASCQHSFNVADIVKEDPEGEEPAAKTAKGPKRKTKSSYPILTRCCHLYCLVCFKKLVFPDWPKNALNAGRTCGLCNRALRLGRDVIEVSPGSTVLAENADGKSRSRRRRKVDDDFPYSAKMLALLHDLLKNSAVNPQSENYDPMADVTEMDEKGQPVVTKSVVFSQWTSMLDLLEGMMEKHGIGCARLDGTMKREDRTEAMERLKSDAKCEVLLVSLRAGGVGLNLVAASRCYLIDPYWNPAVEAQAIDRVHRMGQKRNVIATRYMIEDSIEESMLKIQERKRELANMSLNQSLSKKELHDRKMDDLREIFKK